MKQNEFFQEDRLYRNLETKKLEEMLIFLKKIIEMKNATGKINFKDRSKIYKRFEEFLSKLDDKDHYRQCLFIIAYSKYKDNNFKEACENLDKILKSTEIEEKEILKSNDSLEQKIINLPSQK